MENTRYVPSTRRFTNGRMKETSHITRPVASALIIACIAISVPLGARLAFFSTLQIPLLAVLQFCCFFETQAVAFALCCCGLLLMALSRAYAILDGVSALVLFLASFICRSLPFQFANSALAAYEAFQFAFAVKKPEIAAVLCCTSAIAFGDFAAPAIALVACFQEDFGGVLGCCSGVIAGFASLGLRLIERKRTESSKIRHMQSYAVQNAFVTVKE